MLKKTISFEDFDGNPCTEVHYFHLSKAEIIREQLESITKNNPEGDLTDKMKESVESGSGRAIMNLFRDWIEKSYGVRSEDGRHFDKSPEVVAKFRSSAAYDALFLELISEPDAAKDFVNGLFPANLIKEAKVTARPQDHLSARDKHRTTLAVPFEETPRPDYLPQVDPYQANVPTVEPVLAPTVEQVRISFEQLADMDPVGRENLERRYAGWHKETDSNGIVMTPPAAEIRTDAVEGLISRPQHEVGKGFQVD